MQKVSFFTSQTWRDWIKFADYKSVRLLREKGTFDVKLQIILEIGLFENRLSEIQWFASLCDSPELVKLGNKK